MSGTVVDPKMLDDKDYVYNWNDFYNLRYSKRGKFQASVSQPFGNYGSMYLSASQQTYWNTDKKDSLYQVGYNTSIKGIGFAPIFPDTCYHLTHYWLAAVDIPVASDNPVHYADAIRYNARTPLQGSLLPLTRLVWA